MDHHGKPFEAFDLLTIGILVTSSEGWVLYANQKAEALFAQSKKMLKGRKLPQLIENSGKWFESPRSVTVLETNLTVLLRAPHEPLQALVTIHSVSEDPSILVVEIVSAERTLQHNHEKHMSELSQNTRRLLRNLAHEIKNPLGGIRGAAQLLQSELKDPYQKEYTQVVISEADRLQLLVDKILAPYRHPYQPQKVNVHEILENMRLLIESEFPEGLKIERDYDISAPDLIGDRGQLTQIFLNLLRNAVEASQSQLAQKKAVIKIKTRVLHHVPIGTVLHKAVMNIHIIDNGDGVPPEIADSIFYPLVSSKVDGSGLGLSLVQAFVEQHGGSISVSSAKGNTDFSLQFPLLT